MTPEQWLERWLFFLGPRNETQRSSYSLGTCRRMGWLPAKDYHYNLPWCKFGRRILVKQPPRLEGREYNRRASFPASANIAQTEYGWRQRGFVLRKYKEPDQAIPHNWNKKIYKSDSSVYDRPRRYPSFASWYELYRIDQCVPHWHKSPNLAFEADSEALMTWVHNLNISVGLQENTPTLITADLFEEKQPFIAETLRHVAQYVGEPSYA